MQFFLLIIFHGLSIGYCSKLFGFNLYHTNHPLNGVDRDCLYYFPPENGFAFQFIQYCVRFQLDEEALDDTDYNNSFTLEDLYKRNITSQQLYEWSAPIDLIEHYQIYLENNTSTNKFKFYNCTYPWFGSRCEYRFDLPEAYFGEQIEMMFRGIPSYTWGNLNNLSCYTYLQCDRVGDGGQTPGACLDWREVCNGKVDCIDGAHDEELCWQLETNDCDDNTEFRCHNGLCIPLAFLRDDELNADCLDRSDELFTKNHLVRYTSYAYRFFLECFRDPAFRCEDQMCHSSAYKQYILECGDGSCVNFQDQCNNKRNSQLLDALWFGTNISDNCRRNIECFTRLQTLAFISEHCIYSSFTYAKNIERYCPKLIELSPILFGHVRFVYTNNQYQKTNYSWSYFIPPDYICYDIKLCDHNLFSDPLRQPIDLFGNNSTCRSFDEFVIHNDTFESSTTLMNYLYKLFRKCSNHNQPSSILNSSNLYQCINSSKIISQYRLVDGVEDCLHGDDESSTESCLLKNFNHRFKCDQGKNPKCLTRSCVRDGQSDCVDGSDEKEQLEQSLQTTIVFQMMCDGYPDLLPIMIDGRNETDETECTHFSCNNTYTRCDSFWNCPDGADEVNCEWPPICPPFHHMCLSPAFGNLTCLHIKRANDGIDDCLGASDERKFCRKIMNSFPLVRFRCWGADKCIGSLLPCMKPSLCPINNNISMHFCQDVRSVAKRECRNEENPTHVEQLLCSLNDIQKRSTVHFSIIGYESYRSKQIQDIAEMRTTAVVVKKKLNDDAPIDETNMNSYCNRGIMVHRSMGNNSNSTQKICLCPPAYYGNFCEYQNQRVSLTMQVRAAFDFRILFAIVITLRDDQQNSIKSYDQINYFYEHDCRKKFNIYLLYATRPKSTLTNYSVRIDIFNKETLEYRASWLFPIKFSFLPVYRMAIQLQIPTTQVITQNCDTLNCGNHGHCSQYVNTKTIFCLCNKGWSGTYCDIQNTSYCSSDSLHFDSDICVCPLQKFGSRCYLKHSICTCPHGGTCAPNDERLGQKNETKCICPKGFSGSKCEIRDTIITLSFARDIPIPSSIYVHFIEVSGKEQHNRSTTPKKIAPDQDTVIINRSIPFHIVFIEIEQSKIYYLSVFQQKFVPSANISSTLKLTDRCPSIDELFNKTILELHLLRRMKYYHIPCQDQERTNLTCFYDEIHMCICNQDLRQANCLTFNHNQSYKCEEENLCENQGQCFRDNPICPTTFICLCNECSYGSRCQFSTNGIGLSLDIILGYHIQPNLPFKEQRSVIHVTTVIITFMLIFGLVSGILSIFTFHAKKAREVGCGYYLLVSSYISVSISILFALKFYFFLVSQMGMITNHSYLTFNCILFEFLFKILFSTGDWLNSFVGIERAITVVKDVNFNKTKAKRMAKWIIICTCIVTVVTHVHDPIYRRMIDDEEEGRTWCHVKFSSSVELFNLIILGFHFVLPFILNIMSALIIIINTARQKSTAQNQQPYQHQLRQQFYKLKHLLIGPIILIILALPRLIISFLSGCIKTTRGSPWLYLSGYLISFSPPMLIIFVFVLPSKTYKNELKKTITRVQRYTRRDIF